jgi:hypothetical protein
VSGHVRAGASRLYSCTQHGHSCQKGGYDPSPPARHGRQQILWSLMPKGTIQDGAPPWIGDDDGDKTDDSHPSRGRPMHMHARAHVPGPWFPLARRTDGRTHARFCDWLLLGMCSARSHRAACRPLLLRSCRALAATSYPSLCLLFNYSNSSCGPMLATTRRSGAAAHGTGACPCRYVPCWTAGTLPVSIGVVVVRYGFDSDVLPQAGRRTRRRQSNHPRREASLREYASTCNRSPAESYYYM